MTHILILTSKHDFFPWDEGIQALIRANSLIGHILDPSLYVDLSHPDLTPSPVLVIGHEYAHARMSAFLAIISAIFTKLLQLKWSETDNCIQYWDSVSAVANDEEPWCWVP